MAYEGDDLESELGDAEERALAHVASPAPPVPQASAVRRQQDQYVAMIKAVTASPALDAVRRQQDHYAAMIKAVTASPALDAVRRQQDHYAAMMRTVLPGLNRITNRLSQVAEAAAQFARDIWRVNLRGIPDLTLQVLEQIIVAEGIPLAGVPRPAVSKALIEAPSPAKRREILGRRWEAITQDCEELVRGCESPVTAADREFALKAVAALKDGHSEASQALSASLLDTMVTKHFRPDRVVLVPSRGGYRRPMDMATSR